jgi:hypothetical protein
MVKLGLTLYILVNYNCPMTIPKIQQFHITQHSVNFTGNYSQPNFSGLGYYFSGTSYFSSIVISQSKISSHFSYPP